MENRAIILIVSSILPLISTMSGDLYINQLVSKYTPKNGLLGLRPELTATINHVKQIVQAWAGTQLATVTLSGSYAKNTAIIGSTDVDLFISLKHDTSNALKEVYDLLDKKLLASGYTTRRQNVSIGITHGGIKMDLVPGVKQSALTNDHSIYKRKSDSWTKTNIVKHVNLIRDSRRSVEIRALKIWRQLHNLEFSSFPLELSVLEALSGYEFSQSANNVMTVLRYLANDFSNARIVDPSNSNNIVSDDLTASEKQLIAQWAAASIKEQYWKNIIW